MSRHQQERKIIKRIEYTNQELDSLFQELNGDMSSQARLNWLMKHNAIKIRIHGLGKDIVVLQAQDGSYPYEELSNKWECLNTRENVREFAKRKQLESYEQVVNSQDVSIPNLPATLFNV